MKYTVSKAIQFPAGTRVKLSDEQVRRRGAQLALVKGRQYECLVPVWFKAGEVVDIDEAPKHVLACLSSDAPRRPAAEKVFSPPAATETNTHEPVTDPAVESSTAGDQASA